MSFISSYLTMVANTEPPLPFHQWACLSALSTLAGRRFWMNLGPIQYYPNLMVVLVGHPGVKKSSAMDRAKDIIRAVQCCPIAAAQVTKQFISKAMSAEKFAGKKTFVHNTETIEYNQYAIFATEFTQFLGADAIGMLDFLTTIYTEKIYDCDTKNQGSDLIVGPYITMLACMTPEIVKGFLKMNILTGGFSRRTVFVFANGGNIIPVPSYTPEQKSAQAYCIQWGKELQKRSGEFVMSPDALAWYEKWYIHLHTNMTEIAKPTTEGYFRTKHELLFKVAMLIALSEGQELVLTTGHFELAERFFKPVEEKLERVFEGSGINPNAASAIQICRMLESMDRPINKKHLEAMFFDQATSISELRDTISHLIAVGRLAERILTFNGNIIGTVIGTSQTVAAYSDVQLCAFLQSVVGQPMIATRDPSPSCHPSASPGLQESAVHASAASDVASVGVSPSQLPTAGVVANVPVPVTANHPSVTPQGLLPD